MSTTQDKQDLTVTVTTPEQDAPLSSAAPQTVAAGEDLPEAAEEKAAPVVTSATGPEQNGPPDRTGRRRALCSGRGSRHP